MVAAETPLARAAVKDWTLQSATSPLLFISAALYPAFPKSWAVKPAAINCSTLQPLMWRIAAAVTPAARKRVNASTLQPAFRTSSAVIPSGNPPARAISRSENPAPLSSPSENPASFICCAVNPTPFSAQATNPHNLSRPAVNPAALSCTISNPANFNSAHVQSGSNSESLYP